MEDDLVSSATMTSVTEDLSSLESDEVTDEVAGINLETSSQVTSSDANEEGTSTVTHSPMRASDCGSPMRQKRKACDVAEVSMEGDTSIGETDAGSHDDDLTETDTSIDHHSPIKKFTHASAFCQSGEAVGERQDPKKEQGGIRGIWPNTGHSGTNWYEASCYDHYWRHYRFVSAWCQQHMQVYRAVADQHAKAEVLHRAREERRKKLAEQQEAGIKKPTSSKTIRNRRARKRRKAAKKRMRLALKNAELAGMGSSLSVSSETIQVKKEEEGEQEDEGEIKDSATEDNHQMEISDEMLDFFALTHKHRKEREALKKSQKTGKEEKHVNIEDASGEQKERTEMAPKERPGAKRTSEMRHLYGKGAAMIHGMETALQMTFDRNLDVYAPSFWPNMPLRVIFD